MMNTPRLALGDLSNQNSTSFNSNIYQKVSQSSAVFSKYSKQINQGDTPFFHKEDLDKSTFQNTFAQHQKQKTYAPEASIPEENPDYSLNKENLEGIFSQDNSKIQGNNNSRRFKLDPEERFGSSYTFKEVLITKEINNLRFLLSEDFSLNKKASNGHFNMFFEENELNIDDNMKYESEWEEFISNEEKYELFQPVVLSQKMSEDPAEGLVSLENLSSY